ncbi:MAG: hypothetical protein H6713_28045 [Myxococcales bacterium]|nr:hypothetical protein [Myxococcales bacterium]
MRAPSQLAFAAGLVLTASSCGGGEGSYRVTIYGEAYIEEGIPADVFVDGWAITFDEFLIVVGDITLADGAAAIDGWRVFDLAQPSGGDGHELGRVTVPAGTYSALSYRVAPSADATAGNARDDQVTMMRDAGYSLFVAGAATRGAETYSFAWGFTSDTTYAPCEIMVEVTPEQEGASELTIHADHLFYDDLDSSEPNVAFDLVAAADADADGVITQVELAALDITTQARYQVGSRDITDLWGYISAQTATLGHIDGEGHCE